MSEELHPQTQEAGEPSRRKGDPAAPIIEILAYFAANKKYGYIDIIGNSLDPVTFYESLRDALRDFDSACNSGHIELKENEVPCPQLDPNKVEDALGFILSKIRKSKKDEFVLFSRELALKALARASKLRTEVKME